MKPPVARKLAARHTKLLCLTTSFLDTGSFIKLFHKIPCFLHDYSGFLNSMIFPCMELLSVIFQVSMISRARGNPGILGMSGYNKKIILYSFVWRYFLPLQTVQIKMKCSIMHILSWSSLLPKYLFRGVQRVLFLNITAPHIPVSGSAHVKKTFRWGFLQSQIQTSLLSYRD